MQGTTIQKIQEITGTYILQLRKSWTCIDQEIRMRNVPTIVTRVAQVGVDSAV